MSPIQPVWWLAPVRSSPPAVLDGRLLVER
jgi:hypothetical protein